MAGKGAQWISPGIGCGRTRVKTKGTRCLEAFEDGSRVINEKSQGSDRVCRPEPVARSRWNRYEQKIRIGFSNDGRCLVRAMVVYGFRKGKRKE